ncbi:MAG: zinc-ribbon domain-containing protein, partial [Gemmatimonadales bacterium]
MIGNIEQLALYRQFSSIDRRSNSPVYSPPDAAPNTHAEAFRHVTTCAHCGRSNDDGSRFCMDCGKPLRQSAVAAVPAIVAGLGAGAAAMAGVPATRVVAAAGAGDMTCSSCGHAVDSSQPYCAFCGAKLGSPVVVTSVPPCPKCGTPIASADFKF